ncbi:MAG: ribosome silencing factor [Myxococcota bacterium]
MTPSAPETAPRVVSTVESEALARRIAALCEEAKASDIQVLNVLDLVGYTDFFVVCSARSDRHVRAVHDLIWDELADEKVKPLSVEGGEAAQWILMDYGSVVVHVFYEPVREFYALERLWSEAARLDLPKIPAR